MAHAPGDAHEYPVYGYHNRVYFPIRDVNGNLVFDAASRDSERSIDGGGIIDCTNEAQDISATGGLYYLDLTGAELTSKCTIVKVKSTTAESTDTVIALYPIRLPMLETGTAQAGAGGSITLAAGASDEDNFYNGLFVGITNDVPAGADKQLRRIVAYNGTTKVATIDSNWGTTPSSSTTYEILIPEGYSVAAWGAKRVNPLTSGKVDANVMTWLGAPMSTPIAGVPFVSLGYYGSITIPPLVGGRFDASVGAMAANVLTASALATDAVTEIQSGLSTHSASDVRAEIDANSTQLAAIEADTAEIGAAGAGLTAVPWNAAWDAEVQSEVNDALNVDTHSEPGDEVPETPATLARMISFLYKAWRNKSTQSATQYKLYNNDDTEGQIASVSDDGSTFTRGKVNEATP